MELLLSSSNHSNVNSVILRSIKLYSGQVYREKTGSEKVICFNKV